MGEELDVILVKELKYQRIECVCGMAVMPIDPTPDVSMAIKRTAREYGARFHIVDTTVQPGVIRKYRINELPAVVIREKAYPADVEIIRDVLFGITGRTGKTGT